MTNYHFSGTPLKLIQVLYEFPKDKIFEIKEFKETRNKVQNSKYWKLLNELSLVLKIGIEELHFEMLKNYSVRYEILVPESQVLRGIQYYDKKSTIQAEDGKRFTVYHVYTPSHELKTDEFAILLKGLCEECKQQGIETRSPDEIQRDEKIIN